MKKIIALILCFLMAFSVVACGTTKETQTTSSPTEEAIESTYPITVTDQLGREVVIEEYPDSVVSGYYITTTILIALQQHQRLVGVEAKADTRQVYESANTNIVDLPSVGTAKNFDLEGCAALEPNLVILPIKLKDVIPSLEELGIPVIAVNPESSELLEETITILGKALDCEDRANSLLEYIDEQITLISENIEGTDAPTVYLAGNSSLLSTAGSQMYQNSLIENAGGANVASELSDTYWAEISYEQLITWDPEYIIIASDADYTVDDVLNDASLSGCTAVKNKAVYQFPNNMESLDSPIPASVLGEIWLATILHPEQFEAGYYESALTEFYNDFYGFSYEFSNTAAE